MKYKKRTIKERLDRLYGSDSKVAHENIENLIKEYKGKIVSNPSKMTHEDVILITYGDQVIHPGEPPLETLDHFLNENIKDIINTIHILPFYPYSSDDGFSVIDYKDVSPSMGSWDDINRLKQNYKLMFDGVINHISQYSYWFQNYIDGGEKYKDFFIDADPKADLSKVIRPRTLPLLHPFEDSDGNIRNIWTTFSKDQVDLNYENYKVLVKVLDALLFYVQNGASLIRLDAIAFLWKEIGTECIHLPQTHEIIQLMREVIHKVAPEVVIITETNVPHKENISYFGSGDDEAQMVYNFALPPLIAHSMLKEDSTALTEWANSLTLPSDKVCFFNFTASHDGCGMRPVSGLLTEDEITDIVESVKQRGGYVSYRSHGDGKKSPYELNASYIDIISDPEDEVEIRVKKMILSQAVMLCMPGVPGVYFHSLVGSTSDYQGVKRTGVYRSINREKLNYFLLKDQLETFGNLRIMVFKKYKRLLSIRKEEESFDPYGKFEILDLDSSLFVINRYKVNSIFAILCVNNFSSRTILFTLPTFLKSEVFELIKNQHITSRDLEIEPYGVMWIKYKRDI